MPTRTEFKMLCWACAVQEMPLRQTGDVYNLRIEEESR